MLGSPALSALARSLNELQPPAPRKALGASIMGPYVQDAHIPREAYTLGTCACNTGRTRRGHSSADELSRARDACARDRSSRPQQRRRRRRRCTARVTAMQHRLQELEIIVFTKPS